MKTTLSLLALYVAVLAGGYFYSTYSSTLEPAASSYPTNSASNTSNTISYATTSTQTIVTAPDFGATGTPANSSTAYTLVQVKTHNTSKSCWAVINGNVYDLTTWIAQHPGGEGAILSICGKDGTQAFGGQHENNSRILSILATFKIGALSS
jgi:cytochrome b involved in lipid metabolism